MAHALLGHDGHAFVNGLSWLCNDDVSFHDVPHGRRGRRLTLENNIPRIVPFGDDANEFLAFHHDQRSNVFFSHFRDGVEDGSIRVNRPDVPALLIEQLSYRSHLDPPSDASSFVTNGNCDVVAGAPYPTQSNCLCAALNRSCRAFSIRRAVTCSYLSRLHGKRLAGKSAA